jgi:hypothetical protein
MKKIALGLILLVIVLFVAFKLKPPKQEDYLVKINNYTITPQEFNEEFQASAYAKDNTPESKKEFLSMLIRRKLVLQDAQSLGLDKDKEFLKSIERFWEQSLLKRMMDKKTHEISGQAQIPDSAVKILYEKLKNEGKADKPYEQMYSQIKWSLSRIQESQAVNQWLLSLYKKAEIKINPAYVVKTSQPKAPVAGAAAQPQDPKTANPVKK